VLHLKGLGLGGSGLESTLAGISIVLILKGLTLHENCAKSGLFSLFLEERNAQYLEPEQARKAESNEDLPTN
jgi:hypothetical protein